MLDHWGSLGFINAACVKNNGRHNIWVNIWSWSSILYITSSIVMHNLCGDSKWSRSVSCSVWKVVNTRCLMHSSQSFFVVCSVKLDMKKVLCFKFFHHLMNVFHSTRTISHFSSRIIGMASWAIPIWENFWFKAYR